VKRAELLSTLSIVESGLTDRGFVPILSCFCFDSDSVVAYDDVVAIKAPCKTGFAGGIRGSVLMSMLRASGVDEVEFTPKDAEIHIKLGKSRSVIKLPFLEESDFIFEPPESYAGSIASTPMIIESIVRCMLSAGVNPSLPSRLGLTMTFDDGSLIIYSSDEMTASMNVVDLKGQYKGKLNGKSYTVPSKFFELLLQLDKQFGCESISFGEVIKAEFDGAVLYGKTIQGSDVKQFETIFDSCLEGVDPELDIDIPKRFDRILERSIVLLSGNSSLEATFGIDGEELKIDTVSALGEAHESLDLKKELGDRTFKVSPVLIARILPFVDTIAFGDNALIVSQDHFIHLISIHST
jgi:hypothetical protein